jgi:ABC-type multidrug transport system fused ATPase/permease subunit
MPAAAVVTIIVAVVVVLVLAGFLLVIARVLGDVNKKLGAVMAAVGTITSQTKPVDSVVRSISGNLASAENDLNALLESKVGADRAAELIASVDPLGENPAPDAAADSETPEPDLYPQRARRPFPGGGGGEIRLR